MGEMILHWPQGQCCTVRHSGCRYRQGFLLPQHECEVENRVFSLSPVPMPGLPLSHTDWSIAGLHILL